MQTYVITYGEDRRPTVFIGDCLPVEEDFLTLLSREFNHDITDLYVGEFVNGEAGISFYVDTEEVLYGIEGTVFIVYPYQSDTGTGAPNTSSIYVNLVP